MSAFEPAAWAERGSSLFAGLPGDIAVSFEFFPPKDQQAKLQLEETVRRLAPCSPRFVSLTYGAGGTSRERSLTAVQELASQTSLSIAAHLTCVGASKAEVDDVARAFLAAGVRHIVALRGDSGPPGAPFEPHPQGYRSAAQLVAGLRKIGDFEISVAAYPETHPDAADADADLDNLKRKLDAGASQALTQFFFSPDAFFRFRDRAAAAGVDVPIIPGILPVTNFQQTRKFAAACGSHLPDWMAAVFDGLDDHPDTRQLVAATLAAELCTRLYAGGVRDFHFYTLNRPEMTRALCHLLGRRVPAALEHAA